MNSNDSTDTLIMEIKRLRRKRHTVDCGGTENVLGIRISAMLFWTLKVVACFVVFSSRIFLNALCLTGVVSSMVSMVPPFMNLY